ncbi:hypothetical protein SAMN05192583_0440 [Sphingomonas gellani]|uniref:Transposase n=1 Tax=Sphingomonas gellani TaxID=1166340 RepID=A0A1H7YW84_9SPHN|nr:hypothetical protein [Sphingomonas gellani]SEM50522.1 hypothetical protein SAMN05192583_0440 [Sphingomonas gellani]
MRIQASQKRVDELEAEVAVLKNTPERLDLDLLTQRVLRLEVAASSAAVDPVTGSPVVQTTSPAKST